MSFTQFDPPANQQDLPAGSKEQALMSELWTSYMDAFIQQAIVNDPWDSKFISDQTAYFNPLVTDPPPGDQAQPVQWSAFPNRINQYLGQGASPPNPYNWTQQQVWQFADNGTLGTGTYPIIPNNDQLCPEVKWQVCQDDPASDCHAYGPWGPRGWMDEYCEFSVVRNNEGKITRVDFTCENPEYWQTLWRISPQTVQSIYQDTLNSGLPAGAPQITVNLEDLQLINPQTGQPAIDPSTNQPAYNPLNKWNAGTVSVRNGNSSDYGGAMHLTSTPNTLQTETNLAACGTTQRLTANAGDPQKLICCSQYGQEYRHSDPHIGASTNSIAASGALVSLSNPVGLYIQTPDFSLFQLPSDPNLPPGAQPSDCWQVVRGNTGLAPVGGDYILHAVFQLPPSWIEAGVGFTTGDIQIQFTDNNGNTQWYPLDWGSQIQETFSMGLFAWALTADPPEKRPCKASLPDDECLPMPLQIMFANLWDAYYDTPVPNPMNQPMSVASNTVIVPAIVEQGATYSMALPCSYVDPSGGVTVSFPPPDGGAADITVSNVSLPVNVNYATPGNSFPGPAQVITFDIAVSSTAAEGLREILLVNPGSSKGIPGPAFLLVVPPGYLSGQ